MSGKKAHGRVQGVVEGTDEGNILQEHSCLREFLFSSGGVFRNMPNNFSALHTHRSKKTLDFHYEFVMIA